MSTVQAGPKGKCKCSTCDTTEKQSLRPSLGSIKRSIPPCQQSHGSCLLTPNSHYVPQLEVHKDGSVLRTINSGEKVVEDSGSGRVVGDRQIKSLDL